MTFLSTEFGIFETTEPIWDIRNPNMWADVAHGHMIAPAEGTFAPYRPMFATWDIRNPNMWPTGTYVPLARDNVVFGIFRPDHMFAARLFTPHMIAASLHMFVRHQFASWNLRL